MTDSQFEDQMARERRILEELEDIGLSREGIMTEFKRLRVLNDEDIEKELEELQDFEPLQYIASHEDLIRSIGADAAAGERHWVTAGLPEGREIDEFDEEQYLENYPDLRAAFGTDEEAAERHWEKIGEAEGREEDDFDEEQYLDNYPDLQAVFGEDGDEAATIHYILHGYAEGRTDESLDGGPDEGPTMSHSRKRCLLSRSS